MCAVAMGTLILNFKNYPEVMGKGSLLLARAADRVAGRTKVDIIVCPPNPMVALVAAKVSIPVYSQSVGSESGDKTTGAYVPEAVKAAGGAGTILNHSESVRPREELRELVPRLQGLSLGVCLCARTSSEAAALSGLRPNYVAVEPPELIGTGIAVSRAKPQLITRTVSALKRRGYKGSILCGAGIVTGDDVVKAVELGADGILVSSSVVKAKDWSSKIQELVDSFA